MSATNATKATHAAGPTNAAGTRSGASPSTAAGGAARGITTTSALGATGPGPVHPLDAAGAANASKRLGLGLLGALLAGGLLLAACSLPDDRPPAPDPGDVLAPHQDGTRE
ncbi:hypothetical protein [Streptomyces sp. NPDC058623]|uniref:hypothetical protein n=1 Tax=Streptomyces sp. NPDC058623 TaxID=3346563 RepID=UPI003659B257